MTQNRTQMRELLARHGLAPRKRFGQHFLADRNMVDKIVALAGEPEGVRALEIGAGTGTLTRALAEAGFAVTAYEIDPALEPLLNEVVGDLPVTIRIEDATALDPAEFGTGQWVMVANLPYNVGTPILLDLLRHGAGINRFVAMVQREVADRFVASPGSKDYGLPSVVVGLFGTSKRSFNVPPQVFVPPPNVESSVVTVERVHAPDPIREMAVAIAAAGFSQRRKMLRSSLRGVVDEVEATLASVGVEASARAEELTPENYLSIAAAVTS